MKGISFILFLLLAIGAFAQNTEIKKSPFILGEINKIYSKELGENRTLNIYLPEHYSPDSATTYPVIYLLDGSANEDFVHIVGIVQFLTMIEKMPKSIVVGIANVDRRRDFTFPTTVEKDKKAFPSTGSSVKFIAFIEKELEPFIQQTYKTNQIKTIIGQSLGGLFAAEVLIKKPSLFDNYFIVSPSLWWDSESLLSAAPALINKQVYTNKQVYIAVSNEGKQMENDAKKFNEMLSNILQNNFYLSFLPLPAENHLTILHNCIYQFFEMLYAQKASIKQ